jgi:uncharacterized protein YecA (UPF0149 family)
MDFKNNNMTINQPYDFTVSDDPKIIHSLFQVDERASKLLQETFDDVNRKKKSIEGKLYEYIKEYPEIPQFKNRLSTYYELKGNREKAKELKLFTYQQHPDYLFGKITMALEYYYENKPEEMLALLGEQLELRALYPQRKIFHISEVMSYYKVAALYLNAVDRTTEAWDLIEKMERTCSGHPDIEVTTRAIMAYNLWNASRRMEEREKTSKRVTGSLQENIIATDSPPQFENKIIEELYHYDFRLPPGILKEILDLPEESLIRDLEKVLEDGAARYHYFDADNNLTDQHTQFLLHAIFILAEKRRADCLPVIFNTLKNGEDFSEFYFGDTRTELLWIVFYKLAADDVSVLFSFLKEPNVDTFSKTPVAQALEQLFYHHKNLRESIIEGYRDLSAFFIANQHDESVTDTHVIAKVAATMRDIAVDEFKDQIKELYENNLVYLGYAGNFESLMKYQINEERKKKTIPGIFAMYEKVITSWAGYLEDDKDDSTDTTDYYEVQKPIVRIEPKIGRNDPCPCGSGKKYKKCCLG